MKILLPFLFILNSLFSFAQTTDANGKKQGHWIKKDPSGNHLLYDGNFKDDKPVGKFKYYYPNDSVRAIMNFKQDGKVAYAKLFHMTGKRMAEGKYIQEVKDSVWIYYDESGTLLSKDSYLNGKKTGPVMCTCATGSWRKNVTLKWIYSMVFLNCMSTVKNYVVRVLMWTGN